MELYNKGVRSFIIKKEEAISGCRIPTDEIGKFRAYIDAGKTVQVTDECGANLLRMYPKELMQTGGTRKLRIQKAIKEVEEKPRKRRAKRVQEPEA